MSEFTVMVLRFAFFALLWLFVFLIAGVLRQDLFGPRRRSNRAQRRRGARGRQPAPAPAPAPAPGAAQPLPAPIPAASPPPAPQAPRELYITSGPLTGMVVALRGGPITLGRSGDNTVVLDDDFASSHHARILPSQGQWYVEDLGSTNGTFINQQRLTAAVPLRIGTPVTIGQTTMELRP
ncbi:antibiotic biosynthesis regulator FhaB [Brevibacterium daeguense]|uniref:Antibiotic biosynthesis regulator FhaB n=1 Tax=Brevibacterium daeguense TaxID=909936 RepID=A0ABP8EF54_9MICO|nr:FHA domain-containing protein [Brevibacterium daeguense]